MSAFKPISKYPGPPSLMEGLYLGALQCLLDHMGADAYNFGNWEVAKTNYEERMERLVDYIGQRRFRERHARGVYKGVLP